MKIKKAALVLGIALTIGMVNVKAETLWSCVMDTYNVANNTELTTLTDEQYATIENMDCRGRNINDASLLSKLTNLKTLDLSNNKLTSIDLSANTKLTSLRVEGNSLSSIDVSKNTELVTLFIGFTEGTGKETRYIGNNISSIDLSHNTKLKYFNAAANKITSLNMEGNNSIRQIYLQQNKVSSINIKNCANLETLNLWDNKLTNIDLTTNNKLTSLYLGKNQLSSVNLSNNPELRVVHLMHNKITNLDVSHNTKLTELQVQDNLLSTLDVSQNTELLGLTIGATVTKACTTSTYGNNISSIDLSHNTKLTYFNAAGNKLTSLSLNNNASLEELYLQKNQLTTLSVANNPNLRALHVWENRLESMNVSNLTNLLDLNLATNNITSIDVTRNTKLKTLDLTNNKLTSLDISKNPDILELRVSSNKLSSLDLSNNKKITFLNPAFNNFDKLTISGPNALNHFVVEAKNVKNYDFTKFTNLQSVWINDFANVPVYGTSYEGKNLKEYKSSNVNYNVYSLKKEWNLGNSNESDTITGEIGGFKTISVYSSNVIGAESSCLAIDNPSTNSNVKVSNLNFNGLIYYDGYFDLHFMNLTSDKYEIDEKSSIIAVGNDDNDTILKNLKINQDIELATMKINGKKLQLLSGDKVFKEFTLSKTSSIPNPKTGIVDYFLPLTVVIVAFGGSYILMRKKAAFKQI